MTDLPLNISNVAPVKGSVKQPGKDAEKAQDNQDFSNVLARQVNDSDKQSSSSRPSGDKEKRTEKPETTEENPASENAVPASSDMLAVLLSQQHATAPQTDTSDKTDTPVPPTPNEVTDKTRVTAQVSGSGKPAPATIALPALDTAQSIASVTAANGAVPESAQSIAAGTAASSAALEPAIANPNLSKTALQDFDQAHEKTRNTIQHGAAANGMPLKPLSGNIQVENKPLLALNTAQPKVAGKAIAEILSTADRKEVSVASSMQALPTSITTEQSISTFLPGNLPQVPGAVSTAPAQISTPLSQTGWGEEFGQKVSWMITQQSQSAELHLNPPQLGPLDVTIKMNGDQATAQFTSPHAAVRDAIEQAIPRLRELLADSGIMLSNAMVSDQSAKNNQDNSPRKAQGKAQTDSADNTNEVNSVTASSLSSVRRHNGMVDTFA